MKRPLDKHCTLTEYKTRTQLSTEIQHRHYLQTMNFLSRVDKVLERYSMCDILQISMACMSVTVHYSSSLYGCLTLIVSRNCPLIQTKVVFTLKFLGDSFYNTVYYPIDRSVAGCVKYTEYPMPTAQ